MWLPTGLNGGTTRPRYNQSQLIVAKNGWFFTSATPAGPAPGNTSTALTVNDTTQAKTNSTVRKTDKFNSQKNKQKGYTLLLVYVTTSSDTNCQSNYCTWLTAFSKTVRNELHTNSLRWRWWLHYTVNQKTHKTEQKESLQCKMSYPLIKTAIISMLQCSLPPGLKQSFCWHICSQREELQKRAQTISYQVGWADSV